MEVAAWEGICLGRSVEVGHVTEKAPGGGFGGVEVWDARVVGDEVFVVHTTVASSLHRLQLEENVLLPLREQLDGFLSLQLTVA